MKRLVAPGLAALVFVVVVFSQTSASTALVTPLATPSAGTLISPLETPRGTTYDLFYRETPRKITARAVPYVDRFGATIVEERVVEQPHRDPMIFQRKAAKSQQQATAVTPLTFQSPLGDPYSYHA
jgi:hypothetical protein